MEKHNDIIMTVGPGYDVVDEVIHVSLESDMDRS